MPREARDPFVSVGQEACPLYPRKRMADGNLKCSSRPGAEKPGLLLFWGSGGQKSALLDKDSEFEEISDNKKADFGSKGKIRKKRR